MTRSFYLVFLLVLATQSFAYYPASTRATRPLSHYFVEKVSGGNDAMLAMPLHVRRQREQQFAPRFAHPTRRLEVAGRRHSRCGRRTSRSLLRLSGVGSTTAPPPPTQLLGRGGGGEDGIRVLTQEESRAAVATFASGAKRHRRVQSEYEEYIGLLSGMRAWGEALTKKRVGCKRMVLGNFKRGKLMCIIAAEVVWSTGYLSRDVRMCLRLIVVNPMYDLRTVGFETIDELKTFGMQNALLLDLSSLMAVPSLRVFCLASTQTLDEDPERLYQDPLVQQYNSRVRRCCYVLDDIPDWADLGPYWYEGFLPRSVRFFFRKRFHSVNEFEVTLERPGAGLSTGSGTVGGARVIPMKEAEIAKEIPGRGKVREIERRLASRLLEEMQGENPVLCE